MTFFRKKADASILVYALPCTRAQKEQVLDRVAQINREGSAYNMLGLVLKYSHKPNIMFCSQFVYRMLELAGLPTSRRGRGGEAHRPGGAGLLPQAAICHGDSV